MDGRGTPAQTWFNEAFWLPDRGCFAIALDDERREVDALASNMGHCLWTGIVDEDKAASVARHLMSPEMFTGFGREPSPRRWGPTTHELPQRVGLAS